MNWDQIKNDWKQVSDRIRVTWGKLSDADLTAIAGEREQLSRLLQQRYGYGREKAEKLVDAFVQELSAEQEILKDVGGIQRTPQGMRRC